MLEWTEDFDDHDNTIFEAAGPYQEEDGTVFYYRIVPVLRDNRIQFSTHTSDHELILPEHAEEFPTLEEARADCQQRDNNLRAELTNM